MTTGKTANQIAHAPYGAVFVWSDGKLDYPLRMIRYLDRTDIQVVHKGWLMSKQVGRRYSAIVLDHHLQEIMTEDEKAAYQRLLHTCTFSQLSSYLSYWPSKPWYKRLWCSLKGHRGIHMLAPNTGVCKHCGKIVQFIIWR